MRPSSPAPTHASSQHHTTNHKNPLTAARNVTQAVPMTATNTTLTIDHGSTGYYKGRSRVAITVDGLKVGYAYKATRGRRWCAEVTHGRHTGFVPGTFATRADAVEHVTKVAR